MTQAIRSFFTYDKTLARFETKNGTMTLKQIFIPIFVEMLLLHLMGTINTFMMSNYSDEAVAAVGASTQILSMILNFYTVISTGAQIVVNHYLGAGKQKDASDAAFTAIFFCGGISLLLGILLSLFAAPIVGIMHLEEEVYGYAVTYFKITILFSFLPAVTSSISGIFRSYGKPKITVIVSLFRNGCIAFLDYLIIFRPIELPLTGVFGIAVAYVISNFLGLCLIVFFLIKEPLGISFRFKNRQSLPVIKKILQVGIPGGISNSSYSISQVISTSIIALLGTYAISTKIYVTSIVFYVYVFGLSLGQATSLFIGWMAGAGKYDEAYRLNLQNLKLAISTNALFSLIIYLFSEPLLSLFSTNPEVLATGKLLMGIDLFVEIGRGFNHIEENSLRGAGDVLYPMVVSIISCWTMSILFSYLLGIKLGLGLAGCWIAFAMDELFRGTAYFLRWRSRKWMSKTVR